MVDGGQLQDQLRIIHLATIQLRYLILLLPLPLNMVSPPQDQLPLFPLELCCLISLRITAIPLLPVAQKEW